MSIRPLRVRDVSEATGRGRTLIYDALNSGALAGSQSGPRGIWFITQAAVDAWIAVGCPRYGRVAS